MSLSRKQLPPPANTTTVQDPSTIETTHNGDSVTGPRIRCPQCEWQPKAEDLWMCACTYEWHTFDTGGVCPSCLHQWTSTQCLKCKGWSAHSSWYEY